MNLINKGTGCLSFSAERNNEEYKRQTGNNKTDLNRGEDGTVGAFDDIDRLEEEDKLGWSRDSPMQLNTIKAGTLDTLDRANKNNAGC